MANFTFLRTGLNKITPPHLTDWLLVVCMLVTNLLYAQNNQFYPNRIWVKVLNEQNAPVGIQSIQTPNNVINSVLNNYDIVYFQKAFPWSTDSVISTFYEIYCNCNIDDLIADINQNLQGLIIHPKKLPLPEFMNYNPEDMLWQLTLLYPNDYLWHLSKIQAPQAWNITIGNPDIKIAVIDNFIDATHPDLQSKLLTNSDPLTGQAYTVPTSNLSLYDHGTAVSGFAAAQTTPVGQIQPLGADYASIGFNSSLIFYELGHVPPPNIPSPVWGITGLQKAHHASYVMCADVISISWKNNFCGPDTLGYEEAIVRDILKNGTTIVAAAGNGIYSYNCLPNEQYPYPFSPTYPGCEDIILVTGTDIMDNHNPHNTSNNIIITCNLDPPIVWSHNEEIDICAPSYNLMRLNPGNTFVTKCSGTSMSTPIVAGTAALMKSVNPCLTPHDIDEILSNPAYADPINDANQYPGLLGAGRLNAFKAVQAAQNYIPSHIALIDKNLINRNICKGQSTQLFALGNVCANLQWSNPQTLNNSTIANPIATPQQTMVYTLYASYPNGCIRQDTIIIYVHPLPDKPEISGFNNTCDSLTFNYTISNYNSQQSYVWNVSGGTVINQSGANATIQWNSSQGGTISVITTNNYNCQSVSEIFTVHPCCIPSGLPPSTVYWNNTAASAINPADNPIVINGIFTVNQNLTLLNKQIYLGPDAKIDVTSGKTLTLRNCTLQAGCKYMWDGIYIPDDLSYLNITGCTIKDAQNAIVSRNGGHFTVSSSIFDKNYKHFVVENYNQPHTASIVSSQLLCSGGNSLIAPHVGKRTHKAIEINNVRQITIGDASISTNQNIFDNANYGIYSTESGISVYNNRFQNITLLQGQAKQECMIGTAICSFGTDDYLVKPEINFLVNIGGNAENELNYFHNIGYGVDAHLSQTISIISNNFQQIGANAVEVIDNNARNTQIIGNVINNAASNGIVLARNQILSNVLVTNNIISNVQLSGISYAGGNFSNCNIEQNTLRLCKRGIYTYQNKVGTKIFVQGNNISYQPIWGNPNQFSSGEGILLSETNFGNGVYYYVFNNTVSRYAKGINAKNVSNGSEIRQNNLRLAAYMPVNQLQEGIYLENCQKVTVISNTIQPLSGSMSNYTNAGGVWAQKSPACFISCNATDMIGYGVKCSGPMPEAKVYNNKLKNNSRGIWLANAAIIGPQGDTLNPTYNEWTGNFAAKMYTSNATDGQQSPFWVKNSPPKFNPSNSNYWDFSSTQININTTTQGSNIAPACPVILIGGPKLRHAIALDAMQYADLEEKWMLKHSLYREIVTDTALLADTVLQQYKDSISYTNIGIIDNVKSSLNDSLTFNNNSALLSASSLNNALQPANTIEQLNKELTALQINLRLQNRDSLSQAEIDYLRTIALMCPYKDGDAVFEARALLTWYDSIGTRYINPCEGITVASNRIDNTGNNVNINNTFLPVMDEKQIIHVYPNPAKNVININIINSLEKNFKIEIYSYHGELVYLNETIEKHIQIINIENWVSGIYLYKIFNDTFLQTGLVSVIK